MNSTYDCAIIGGGLAGLTAAIQLAKKGRSVVLVEKNHYPFHKVCGEYISMESWDFLKSLGVPLDDLDLPKINHFTLTHPRGKKMQVTLPQGGFGISRYSLDNKLSDLAPKHGVVLLQGLTIDNVRIDRKTGLHVLHNEFGELHAKTAIGAFGKRSRLDKDLKRPFMKQLKSKENNFVGVKYHVESDIDPDKIELHLFEQGYAGVSRIEDGKSCFCYLVSASVLKRFRGDIEKMEQEVLFKNPYLKERLEGARKLYAEPLTISQIEFGEKEQVFKHLLMAGDSAGMITPLTGNGMSMAMHASKLACEVIEDFLDGKIDQEQMEKAYTKAWKSRFEARVKRGRRFQSWFFNESFSARLIGFMSKVPALARMVIKSSHGKPF